MVFVPDDCSLVCTPPWQHLLRIYYLRNIWLHPAQRWWGIMSAHRNRCNRALAVSLTTGIRLFHNPRQLPNKAIIKQLHNNPFAQLNYILHGLETGLSRILTPHRKGPYRIYLFRLIYSWPHLYLSYTCHLISLCRWHLAVCHSALY